MPQQNPFQAAISGLIGGRKPLGSIRTPDKGEGQFYEDPSITAHGLLKAQEDEIQNRMYNETDPAGIERLRRFLTGTQADITENEASMRNPEMEAGYAANLKAQRAGFPSSAAEGVYGRSQDEAKMRIPVEVATTTGQYDVNQENARGRHQLDLQREGNREFGAREDRFYNELEEAQKRAAEAGKTGGVQQFLSSIIPPGPRSAGRFGFTAPQRPPNVTQESNSVANELARIQIDNPRNPGSTAALVSVASALMSKQGVDPESQKVIIDIIANPQPGDENLSSDQLIDSDDPAEAIRYINILRQLRGK